MGSAREEKHFKFGTGSGTSAKSVEFIILIKRGYLLAPKGRRKIPYHVTNRQDSITNTEASLMVDLAVIQSCII